MLQTRMKVRIVQRGARLEAEMEGNALIEAVKVNDVERVRTLIQSGGVDVNARPEYGMTALHFAASLGFFQCVQVVYVLRGL